MRDGEDLVILAVDVDIIHLPLFKDVLQENGIEYFVSGGNLGSGYAVQQNITSVSDKSTVIGAYIIRIKEKDVPKATKVLSDLGYPVFSEDDSEQSFLEKLASPTENIPMLAKYPLNIRLIAMLVIITFTLVGIMYGYYYLVR